MSKLIEASCNNCYFRQAGLCALPGNTPCPTHRLAKDALGPPLQPRLVPVPTRAPTFVAA